ncbi:PREDICTED: uncharacterized protein LOC107194187 [Dufourea novaeangliae]|uniref:uncharacterized protein LOC107194187 n=1 Tax=Dufourea novaeangliae TaxID=178035 RepID=UPI0007677C8E|nr:PREDICTED: uncharacterized protein LOC107194187 [Dufourea novaeangliae]
MSATEAIATGRMSNTAGLMETDGVSNMLKDGSKNGPPLLFRHASMQRIRHCCQNLNLFPYLLYSFENSKSHPIARKVHLYFGLILQGVTARIFVLYKTIRQSLVRGIRQDDHQQQLQESTDVSNATSKATVRIERFGRRKRNKQCPLFLTVAIYFAPLILLCQTIGLLGLMVLSKYTPGFIFLTSALLFLGCISLKILFHETVEHTAKYEKNKVQ